MVFYIPGPGAERFHEVVQIHYHALTELLAGATGVKCHIQDNPDWRTKVPTAESSDRILFLIYHAVRRDFPFDFDSGPPYIIVNYEQHSSPFFHWPHFLERARRATAIWEYSWANRQVWTRHYRLEEDRVVFMPLGYHAQLSNVMLGSSLTPSMTSKETTPLLFYGTYHARRQELLDRLRQAGHAKGVNLNMTVIMDEHQYRFGSRLAQTLAERPDAIVLNIHYYLPAVLEATRIIPAVAAGHLVITERGDDPVLEALYSSIAVIASSEQHWVELVLHYAMNPEISVALAAHHQHVLTTSPEWKQTYLWPRDVLEKSKILSIAE